MKERQFYNWLFGILGVNINLNIKITKKKKKHCLANK